MNKTAKRAVELDKGHVDVYTENGITLYAYQTRDLINDEVFILAKNGRGVVIELPCFHDNIRELTAFLRQEGITVEGKLVAYHAAGASFLPEVPAYGTASSVAYNTTGGGAALVANFHKAFGGSFDESLCAVDHVLEEGETEIAGIRFLVRPNAEAYDLEIPEINCVYTHMMGHDCHSIVAGCPHADGILSQLNYYLRKGFDLVLLMATDVMKEGTQILYVGDDESVRQAFNVIPKENTAFLPRIMSRKKQVIPMLSDLWT